MTTVIWWTRRDLRLADNLGLAAAAAATPAVTGVVVLDPAELAAVQEAPARRWFLTESLGELSARWQAAGGRDTAALARARAFRSPA